MLRFAPIDVTPRFRRTRTGLPRASISSIIQTMKSLLLVAHGSRRTESNEEIAALTRRLAAKAEKDFGAIEFAFLELAEPLIPDGIQRCIDKGATSVSVVPYFLARGTHVADDIPEQVAIKQKEYPEMDIHITDYLGTSDELVDVLIKLAR